MAHCVRFIFFTIAVLLSPAWYTAFSRGKNNNDSAAPVDHGFNSNQLATSIIDYFICIWPYASVSSLENYIWADLILFRVDKDELNCYKEHLAATKERSVTKIATQNIRNDYFRRCLISKLLLNTASAFTLFFASLTFITKDVVDTSYMYQIALSSLIVSYFASNSLSTHDKCVGRLKVRGDGDNEDDTNKKKAVRDEIKIGNGTTILYQVITVYIVTVLNIVSVLVGAIGMDDTIFQFIKSRM